MGKRGRREHPNSVQSRTREAYRTLRLHVSRRADLITNVLKALGAEEAVSRGLLEDASAETWLAGPALTPRVIQNLILLNQVWGLKHKALANLLRGDAKSRSKVTTELKSIARVNALLLPLQLAAQKITSPVVDWIEAEGGDLSRINLHRQLDDQAQGQSELMPAPSLQELSLLRQLREEFAADDPRANWRFVDLLIDLGAIDTAETRLDDMEVEGPDATILEAYLRARIAMLRSGAAHRAAARNRMLVAEMEPLSGAEQAYKEMADQEEWDAEKHRRIGAETALAAWKVLAPLSWSEFARTLSGFRSAREVRGYLAEQVVLWHRERCAGLMIPLIETRSV